MSPHRNSESFLPPRVWKDESGAPEPIYSRANSTGHKRTDGQAPSLGISLAEQKGSRNDAGSGLLTELAHILKPACPRLLTEKFRHRLGAAPQGDALLPALLFRHRRPEEWDRIRLKLTKTSPSLSYRPRQETGDVPPPVWNVAPPPSLLAGVQALLRPSSRGGGMRSFLTYQAKNEFRRLGYFIGISAQAWKFGTRKGLGSTMFASFGRELGGGSLFVFCFAWC